jgi:hypothetical protein
MNLIRFVVLLSLLAPASALAAPCKTQGAPDAKELKFNLNDAKIVEGLTIAFQFGLLPKEFPEDAIAANKAPCSRGPFPFTNNMTMELRGEDTDSPPRWATSPLPGPTVFVAVMPQPAAALRFAEQAQSGGSATFDTNAMMVAVVLTQGDDKRYVFHFFDKMPDDTRLKALLRPIVISKGRWQAMFDMSAMTVTPNTR